MPTGLIPTVPIRFEPTRRRVFQVNDRNRFTTRVIERGGSGYELLEHVVNPNRNNNWPSVTEEIFI